MFHIERGVVCRCGWHAEHYNRSHLADLYREHLRIVRALAPEKPNSHE